MSGAVDPPERMERVFYNLHRRASILALTRTSARSRNVIEHTALVLGVMAFCIVLISHRTFVYRGLSVDLEDGLNGDGIGRAVAGSILGTKGGTLPPLCLRSVPGFDASFDVLQVAIGAESLDRSYASSIDQSNEEACSNGENSPPEPLCSYSSMKGLLLLPKSAQKRHNVRVQRIVVARTDPLCFGEPFLQNLVFDFGLGPSSVAMNWLLGLNDGVGYILPSTGHIIDLARYASDYYFLMPRPGDGTAPSTEFKSHRKEKEGDRTQRRRGRSFLRFKLGVLGASSFLFFVTTTLVSFTLRETQDRMLNFTFQLQEHVRNRIPVGRLVATHVVENLVLVSINIGAIFFLIEFYGGDKFLAFMVLTLVWVSEVFSVISMRTHQGMTFFPRVVFLYFTLFHAYYFSCPFGFSYLSLTSSGFFITHSMLFFWNRFELPAILCESVTANTPRQTRREGNVRVAGIPSMPPTIDTMLLQAPLSASSVPSQPLLPRPLTRGQNLPSFGSMLSLGRAGAGDDGDDSSSYMIFMNGEVVMHRDRNMPVRSPSPSTDGPNSTFGQPEHTPESAVPPRTNSITARRNGSRAEDMNVSQSSEGGAARPTSFRNWTARLRNQHNST